MSAIRYTLLALVSILLLWQIIIILTKPPTYILPSPFEVLIAFKDNYFLIYKHAFTTLTEILFGLVIGVILGSLTALMLVTSKLLQSLLKPILLFSQALPVFAIAPVLTLWLGYGIISKIVMAILIIYFPVTSAFYDGLNQIPKGYSDLARILKGKKFRVLIFIKIPHALPSLFSGIRLAAVYAPIGAIIGEWVGSSDGLGYLMLLANGRVKTELLFASLLTLGLMSVSLYGITNYVIFIISKRFKIL